jgi:branched-subunit amino acid transport protein
MPTLTEWLLILSMAAVTFATRFPALAIVGRLPLPNAALRALRYVPPAVLTAIIIPDVLLPGGTLTLSLSSSPLVAAVACALTAWFSRNLLLTITIGMGVFLVHRLLF